MNKISPYIYPGCPVYTETDGKKYLQHITVDDIAYTVCNRTGISIQSVRTTARTRDVADTRAIICYLCDKHLPLTHMQIIYRLNIHNRHRTIVISNIHKIINLIATDPTFAEMIRKMTVSLMGIDIDRQLQKKAA